MNPDAIKIAKELIKINPSTHAHLSTFDTIKYQVLHAYLEGIQNLSPLQMNIFKLMVFGLIIFLIYTSIHNMNGVQKLANKNRKKGLRALKERANRNIAIGERRKRQISREERQQKKLDEQYKKDHSKFDY